MRSAIPVSILAFSFLTGCAIGPNYQRPAVSTPATYRQPSAPTEPLDKQSLADLRWSALFQDEVITDLVKRALSQSHDLEAATQRVIQARAQLGISRAQLAPNISATGSYNATRSSSIGSYVFLQPGTNLAASYTQAGFNLSWELDFWGRIRRLNESARAQYLASEEARHAVLSSLIADVITSYLTLGTRPGTGDQPQDRTGWNGRLESDATAKKRRCCQRP